MELREQLEASVVDEEVDEEPEEEWFDLDADV